jgi:hypothetical protein
MRPYDDPSDLSPDQRFRELSRIFASGVLRLRRRVAVPQQRETVGNSFAGRLELLPDTVLSVSVPVNAPESPT